MSPDSRAVLFVANFPPDTGYAWDFIQRLYAGVAGHLAEHGVRSIVAYPKLPGEAPLLEGSGAEAIELPVDLSSGPGVQRVVDFVREQSVRVLYLTDRPSRDRGYLPLRRAGVEWIVVHDHTSGHRPLPNLTRRIARRLLNRVPGICADVVVTVSDYVTRRQRDVTLIPPDRLVCVKNGVPPLDPDPDSPEARSELGLNPSRPLIACACRAHPVKGVHHLFHAFDRLLREDDPTSKPVLVYAGDGPQLSELKTLRERLASRGHIVIAGYRPGAIEWLRGAAFFVVPSVWQDAFPLSVMEPMSLGKPVIASRVGGVPEMVVDGETGILVEPKDQDGLTAAIRRLLASPDEAARMGRRARTRVETHFRPETQHSQITYLTELGLGGPCDRIASGRPPGFSPPRGRRPTR